MSANYWASSQKAHWQLTRSSLTKCREQVAKYDHEMGKANSFNAYDGDMRIYLHGCRY